MGFSGESAPPPAAWEANRAWHAVTGRILGVSMAEPQKGIPIIFICKEDIDMATIDADAHVRETEKSFRFSTRGRDHVCQR